MANSPIKLSPITARPATTTEHDGWRLAERFSTVETEAAAIRTAVGLADLSAWGKILIQGRGANAAIKAALGDCPTIVGEAIAVGAASKRVHLHGTGLLACLTREDWYLVTPIGGEEDALEKINAAIAASGVFAHATDLTHGKGAILLAGPHAARVLPKVCALDFHPAGFPNRHAAQSSVAKVQAIILRDDVSGLLAYQIHVSRSEADSVWGALFDAAGEFGAQPVGYSALTGLMG